jgi:hypothetical protein
LTQTHTFIFPPFGLIQILVAQTRLKPSPWQGNTKFFTWLTDAEAEAKKARFKWGEKKWPKEHGT